jgi:hypothetical protein
VSVLEKSVLQLRITRLLKLDQLSNRYPWRIH